MTSIKRVSAWTWNTSATGGVGVGVFAASGGQVVLNDPSGTAANFYYGSLGGGLSKGIKSFPKVGKIIDPKGISEKGLAEIAPKSWENHGVVATTTDFYGDELQPSDFSGPCALTELGGGLIIGYSLSIFLVDINPLALTTLVPGGLMSLLKPKALIIARGPNVGAQASGGGTVTLGFMVAGGQAN